MPSEYEIYRAYAGLNKPQSKLDYFLQGVGKLQGIAESNKRMELQERRLEQDDKRANERLEQARTQEERMREQYEFNKNKYEEESFNRRNEQSWKSMVEFAKGMQLGQRHPFLEKMATEVLDDDWMQQTGSYDMLEAFKVSEEETLGMNTMYSNMRDEDSADKIKIFRENHGDSLSSVQNQLLRTRENNIRKEEKKWKPFDLDLLNFKDRSTYNAIKSDYDEKLKMLIAEKSSNLPSTDPDLGNKVATLETQLKGYQERASTAPLPVFTASAESLQAGADDDDLMSAFFGDESNNLDEFIQSRSGAPKPEEPEESEVKTEVKTEEVEVGEPDTIKQEDTQVVKSGGVSFEVPINSLNDDMKKLFESDYMSKIKNTRAKERSQVISNILGRKISEEESEALLSELSSIKIQALTKKGLEDIKKGVGASLKEKRYPQKAGRSTYRAQG